jgi:hypothetical protein
VANIVIRRCRVAVLIMASKLQRANVAIGSRRPTWPSGPGPERTAEIRWRTARPPWTLFDRPVRRGRRPLIPVTSAQQCPQGPPLSWISSATDG